LWNSVVSIKHAFHPGHAVLPNNFQFPITHISLTRALRRHGGSSSIHRHHRYKTVTGENHLMDNSVFNGHGNYNRTFSSYSSASQRDVRYRFHSHNSQLSLIQFFVLFCYGYEVFEDVFFGLFQYTWHNSLLILILFY